MLYDPGKDPTANTVLKQDSCKCGDSSWDGGHTPGTCFINGCDPAHGVVWRDRFMFQSRTHPVYFSKPGREWLREQLDAGRTDLPWGQIVHQLITYWGRSC